MSRYMLFNYYTSRSDGGLCDAVALCDTEEDVYAAAQRYPARCDQYLEVLDMQEHRMSFIDLPPPFDWMPLTDFVSEYKP